MIKQIGGIPLTIVKNINGKRTVTVAPIEKLSKNIDNKIAKNIEARLKETQNSGAHVLGIFERVLDNGDVVILENKAKYSDIVDPVFADVVTLFKKDGTVKTRTKVTKSKTFVGYGVAHKYDVYKYIESVRDGKVLSKKSAYVKLDNGCSPIFWERVSSNADKTDYEFFQNLEKDRYYMDSKDFLENKPYKNDVYKQTEGWEKKRQELMHAPWHVYDEFITKGECLPFTKTKVTRKGNFMDEFKAPKF
ncbi:MAG: hypothetical protein KHX03_01790 [Clostridium sp.]|nr:hypothetical protein [Clostridium sp.]